MSAAYKVESLTPTPSEEPRPKRPRPINKRVFGSIAKSTSKVIDEGFREALARDPKRERRWVVLLDGNGDQIRAVVRAAKRAGVEITIVADLIHLIEYLWPAAYDFHPHHVKARPSILRVVGLHGDDHPSAVPNRGHHAHPGVAACFAHEAPRPSACSGRAYPSVRTGGTALLERAQAVLRGAVPPSPWPSVQGPKAPLDPLGQVSGGARLPPRTLGQVPGGAERPHGPLHEVSEGGAASPEDTRPSAQGASCPLPPLDQVSRTGRAPPSDTRPSGGNPSPSPPCPFAKYPRPGRSHLPPWDRTRSYSPSRISWPARRIDLSSYMAGPRATSSFEYEVVAISPASLRERSLCAFSGM